MSHLNESLKTEQNIRVSVDLRVVVPDDESNLSRIDKPLNQTGTQIEKAVQMAELQVFRYLREGRLSSYVELLKNEFGVGNVRGVPFDEKWAEGNERLFEKILFLGNGDCSLINKQVLFERLNHAFSLLGALQQGVREETDQEYEEYIENVARDVVMALTGKEIEFK